MTVTFRAVKTETDLALLDRALRALSRDLGDAHAADRKVLHRALAGATASAYGLLALGPGPQADALRGAALFSPAFSTVRGAAGVLVSDLWIAEGARGQRLGQHVLTAVATRAGALWGAAWMALAVYDHSPAARRFYDRLGFEAQSDVTQMHLPPAAMRRLTGEDG